ncbi:MAG: anti-sigma F factor antagonist, partial [Firmicutes bacterium]|nr:anti-sigma F factor antagonist [Bacillota bacterium]
GKVAICSPSKMVARLIEMSGLLRIISVYRDEQEALKKI